MQTIDCKSLQAKCIQLNVLRLDGVHPVVSGNKLFKLYYFLENVSSNTLVTFGGAYSNHLVATAFACRKKNIRCIGIVRGEEPKNLSHTLLQCMRYGMKLHFISRELYAEKDSADFIEKLKTKNGDCSIVPEGGYDKMGANGAAHIMDYIDDSFTHICCAVGTGTTLAGLLSKIKSHQQAIAFPVLKGIGDMKERIHFLSAGSVGLEQLHVEYNYHFGGYAKKTPALIQFMNGLYQAHQLPTDFVYTGKMMFGVMEMIKTGFFAANSKICCVHTGGLQGNLSLPKNTLTY